MNVREVSSLFANKPLLTSSAGDTIAGLALTTGAETKCLVGADDDRANNLNDLHLHARHVSGRALEEELGTCALVLKISDRAKAKSCVRGNNLERRHLG